VEQLGRVIAGVAIPRGLLQNSFRKYFRKLRIVLFAFSFSAFTTPLLLPFLGFGLQVRQGVRCRHRPLRSVHVPAVVAYAEAAEKTGLAYGTLKNAKHVANAFHLSRRRDKLSWSHHADVAALHESQQEEFLDLAEKEGWTRRRPHTAGESRPGRGGWNEAKYTCCCASTSHCHGAMFPLAGRVAR
jgi:hypothetical protein